MDVFDERLMLRASDAKSWRATKTRCALRQARLLTFRIASVHLAA